MVLASGLLSWLLVRLMIFSPRCYKVCEWAQGYCACPAPWNWSTVLELRTHESWFTNFKIDLPLSHCLAIYPPGGPILLSYAKGVPFRLVQVVVLRLGCPLCRPSNPACPHPTSHISFIQPNGTATMLSCLWIAVWDELMLEWKR